MHHHSQLCSDFWDVKIQKNKGLGTWLSGRVPG
jgi:hypothetical protein